MKKLYIVIGGLLMTLSACTNKAGHPNLQIIEDKAGDTIAVDDFLSATFTEKTEDGKVIGGSYEYDMRSTLLFREQSAFKGDFFDMLGQLSEGDSATFKVSIDSLRTKTNRIFLHPPPGKYFIYTIRVNKVIGRGKLNDSAYSAAIEKYKRQALEHEQTAESTKLANYIQQNKLHPQQTASGLQYILLNATKGLLPAINDTVLVNYTAHTLTGKIFETSDRDVAIAAGILRKEFTYAPMKVPVFDNAHQPLSGFLEAMHLFGKGAKVKLIVPSKLAYGAGSHGALQPYTPIICDIEVLDIIPQKPK